MKPGSVKVVTREEADALPRGSVIVGAAWGTGQIEAQLRTEDGWVASDGSIDDDPEPDGPFEVIWEPRS
jgi:hypothetical protein